MNQTNKKPSGHKRSLSRLMAAQILYQFHCFKEGRSLDQIKRDVIENYALSADEEPSSYIDKIDEKFLQNLLNGIALDLKLDEEIKPLLKEGYNFEKLDEILQQILRLGTFELKYMHDVPYKVIIDEYVDIAAAFFEEKRITFINGILENLAKKFREQEIKK